RRDRGGGPPGSAAANAAGLRGLSPQSGAGLRGQAPQSGPRAAHAVSPKMRELCRRPGAKVARLQPLRRFLRHLRTAVTNLLRFAKVDVAPPEPKVFGSQQWR